jgi:ABC-type branched-subunit amino acid transport system substrate-binding protein
MRGAAVWFIAALIAAGGAAAEPHYSTGATDSEIKLGQTLPYSGPLSAYSTIGRAALAYFQMINEQGGVNGRKITLISLDDGYSPPKTVEATRRLVEQDGVFAIFSTMGTSPNSAIQKYLNARKIPQVFIGSGAAAGTIPSTSRGPSAACRPIASRAASTRGTSSSTCRTPRSASFTRTTIRDATSWPGSTARSATRRPRRSSRRRRSR